MEGNFQGNENKGRWMKEISGVGLELKSIARDIALIHRLKWVKSDFPK